MASAFMYICIYYSTLQTRLFFIETNNKDHNMGQIVCNIGYLRALSDEKEKATSQDGDKKVMYATIYIL